MNIKNKHGNCRSKLCQAGSIEVSINRKSRNKGDGAYPALKRAKQVEINHVPHHPGSHTEDSPELERLARVEEFKKNNKNVPMVSEVMERWPALFC